MDAPLAQCTREEQRAVVRFLWSEGSLGTFLSRIVTGDESWVHHYSPETKRQNLE